MNDLPWKRAEIILSFLRLHPSTACQGQKPGGPHARGAAAKRSYPTSEVGRRPGGATPPLKSGAAAERSYPSSEALIEYPIGRSPGARCPVRTGPRHLSLWGSRILGLESESESHSVMSNSSRPYGLYSPWNSPGQNTGVGSFFLLQRIFQPMDRTQVSCIAGRFCTMSHKGSP